MSYNELRTATLSLSVNSIKESVYALSALHCYLSVDGGNPPPILTCDHSEALDAIIRHSAVAAIMELADIGAGIVDSGAGDIVAVDVPGIAGEAAVMKAALERAVVMDVMKCCFMNYDDGVAERYGRDYDSRLGAIKEKAGANAVVPHLRPVRY